MRYRCINLQSMLLAAAVVLSFKPSIAANVTGPGEVAVRRCIESVRQLRSSNDPAERRRILDEIDQSLAIDKLAQHALGPQWGKLDAKEHTKFVTLFTGALEKLAYPRASQALATLDVTYLGEDTKPSGHLVRTVVANKGGGKIQVNYLVDEEAGRWRINDVELDGESLSRAATSRIQAALKQDGYVKMVTDLRKRVAQADAARAAK